LHAAAGHKTIATPFPWGIFTFFAFFHPAVSDFTLSLPPISGAARLNRESGANPGQFPLL
jgi:hypothetical protein